MTHTGARRVSAELYRATITGALVEDISDLFRAGQMDFSLDRDVKTMARLTISDPATVNPVTDFLAPFVRLEYDDGEVYQQLGLYALDVPTGTYRPNEAVGTFVCYDLTSLLMSSAYEDTDNVAAAVQVDAEIKSTVQEAGLSLVAVPDSTRTVGKDRSFPPGTTRFQKINALADFSGWARPYAALNGTIIQPWGYRKPSEREPSADWTDADLTQPIEVQPTAQVPRNVVVVIKDNPSDAPLVGTARNDDPTSPSSTVATGLTRTRVVSTSEADTQTEVDDLAEMLLAEERLQYRTINVSAFTTPVLSAYDAVRLSLTGQMQEFSGLWAVRSWAFGFTHADAVLVTTMSQTIDEQGNYV